MQIPIALTFTLALGSFALQGAEAGVKPRSFAVQVTGAGQPIILIPGLAPSGAVWDGTVAHLKDHYQCRVVTLAGFAGQPRIEAPFLETVRNDLASYIRANKLDHPMIFGHSLGGFMALWLGAHDPDLVGASRKHILNLTRITSIDPWANGGLLVKLNSGHEVEMSRRQAQKFRERMSL